MDTTNRVDSLSSITRSYLFILGLVLVISFVRETREAPVYKIIIDENGKLRKLDNKEIINSDKFSSNRTIPKSESTKPKVWCRHAFLNLGVEPGEESKYVDDDKMKGVLEKWLRLDCKKLFCKATSAADGDKTQECTWTKFAVESLVPRKEEAKQLCGPETLAKFQLEPRWQRYSFNDWFKGFFIEDESKRYYASEEWKSWKAELYVPNNTHSFSGSLWNEYHDHPGSSASNWTLLLEIVQDRAARASPRDIPPADAVVIHVRLGDVVDASNMSVSELLRKPRYFYSYWDNSKEKIKEPWNQYVRPLSHFSKLPFSEVVLIGATHHGQSNIGGNVLKSCLYTRAIQRYLERRGTKVTLRLGHAPDDDIIFTSQSKFFMPCGGQFSSELLAGLVKFSGGVLIYRN